MKRSKNSFLPKPLIFIFVFALALINTKWGTPKSASEPFSPSLLITINCNHYQCERAKISYETWGKEIISRYKNVSIKFVTICHNCTDPSNTIYAKNHSEEFIWRQLYYNNMKAYSYFLKTDKEWLLRTTEDVYINPDNLISLLNRIRIMNHNKTVLIGQVIKDKFYVHGGPGWIMNRKGVEVWYTNRKHFNSYFEHHYNIGDDVILDEYQRVSSIPEKDMHTNLFYGFPISEKTEGYLINKSWNEFPRCPPIVDTDFLDRAKVKDIAIWHSGTKSNYAALHGKEVLNSAPDDLYFIHMKTIMGFETVFCHEK